MQVIGVNSSSQQRLRRGGCVTQLFAFFKNRTYIYECPLPSNVSRRGRCVNRSLAFLTNGYYIYECQLSKQYHIDMEVSLSLSHVTNGCP